MTCEGPLGERRPPLTMRELMAKLTQMGEKHPDTLNWPVHLLSLESEDEDDARTGLLNQIETDCFDAEQGNVVSLVSADTFNWHQCMEIIPGSWENRMVCQRHRGHEGEHTNVSERPRSVPTESAPP